MTLTTHIAVGAGVAAPLIATGHPILGVIAGLASHYALDRIPHWSYELPSVENGKVRSERHFISDKLSVLFDISKIGIDFCIGTALMLAVGFHTSISLLPLLIAGWAGALPDALQGVQLIYKKFPVPYIQKFHDYFHFDNGGEHDLPPTFTRVVFQILLVASGLIIIFAV